MKKSKNFEFEGFYIADSLGSLHPSEIVDIINLIKKEAPVKIGLHAHNNKLMALANSLEAARVGATYLDSTIKGMGRGCGNTQKFVPKSSGNISLDALFGKRPFELGLFW